MIKTMPGIRPAWASRLLIVSMLAACTALPQTAPFPTTTGAAAMSHTSTSTSLATTPAATQTPLHAAASSTADVAPTSIPSLPEPTLTPPAVTPTAAPPTPSTLPFTTPSAASVPTILSFSADIIEDIPGGGKRVLFKWETTGATRVRIWSGATQRNPKNWDVPATGAMVADLLYTSYANPSMLLVAEDDSYDQADRTIVLQWPCAANYFFSPAPARCPSGEPLTVAAVEQSFEHGRMIWLERIRFVWGEEYTGLILVLYGGGLLSTYHDTWTADQPESDPGIVPPAGLYQPVNGFGKLWREHQTVRNGLGWALAPEQSFQSAWQGQVVESARDERYYYVQLLDGRAVGVFVYFPGETGENLWNGWTLIK